MSWNALFDMGMIKKRKCRETISLFVLFIFFHSLLKCSFGNYTLFNNSTNTTSAQTGMTWKNRFLHYFFSACKKYYLWYGN